MQRFLQEIDHIYVLCIPSRKPFIMEQFTKLGALDKLTVFDAYTDKSPETLSMIEDHRVHAVYMHQPRRFACVLGSTTIMEQISAKKYNYALVIQDDVLFLENMFEVANKHITKENISRHFDVNRPYILYLISKSLSNNTVREGIIKSPKMKYGEPAWIINHRACNVYLNHRFPVTSPIDEYKIFIESRRSIQRGLLVPYVVGELSANYSKVDTKGIKHAFNRSMLTDKKSHIFNLLVKYPFFVRSPENNMTDIIKVINPSVTLMNNIMSPRPDMMYYDTGYVKEIKNNYIVGATISDMVIKTNNNAFFTFVRGQISADIVLSKLGVKVKVGDLASLVPSYIKQSANHVVTQDIVTILVAEPLRDVIVKILSANIVATNDVDYLSMAIAYGKQVAWVADGEPSDDVLCMFRDRYNSKTLLPIDTSSPVYSALVRTYPQPSKYSDIHLSTLRSLVPFTSIIHKAHVEMKQPVQCFK